MTDYIPISVKEIDIRNFVSPPLDYNDVSTAEILIKIEAVETYVKRVFFEGGTIPSDGRIGILLLVVSNILSRSDLLKKYGVLNSEQLGDYRYELSNTGSSSKGGGDPLSITKTWHQMGLEILKSLSASYIYQIRIVNE